MDRKQAESVLDFRQGGTGQGSWKKGDILYAIADNVLKKLPAGATGKVLVMNAKGLPEWGVVGSVSLPGGWGFALNGTTLQLLDPHSVIQQEWPSS
jgi:hypothetical protein